MLQSAPEWNAWSNVLSSRDDTNKSVTAIQSWQPLLNFAQAENSFNLDMKIAGIDSEALVGMRERLLEVLGLPSWQSKFEKVGEDADVFMRQELRLLSALVDGRALRHHMEDSYHLALARAVAHLVLETPYSAEYDKLNKTLAMKYDVDKFLIDT